MAKRSIPHAPKSDLYLDITRGTWLKNPELDYDIAQLIETPTRTGSDTASALSFMGDVTRSRTVLYGTRRAVLIRRPMRLCDGRSFFWRFRGGGGCQGPNVVKM